MDPETGADTPVGVALLGGSGAGRGTGSRLMPRLAAIVAETLLRRAILCNVPH